MPQVKVRVTKWLDSSYPGFVEVELKDARGKVWIIHEKVPVLTTEDDLLTPDAAYPIDILIDCAVLSKNTAENIARILLSAHVVTDDCIGEFTVKLDNVISIEK